MTGTLICDEDGLYDPRAFNDRLLLGLKGHDERGRAALHPGTGCAAGSCPRPAAASWSSRCPSGWSTTPPGTSSSTPTPPSRARSRHLFATFEATGSATAVVKAFRAAGLSFPWRHPKGPRKGEVDWKPLRHSHRAAGAAQPPLRRRVHLRPAPRAPRCPAGSRPASRLPREEWISFIPGAHPGYITLDQCDANIARLAANAAAHGRDRAAGPPREGPALLQGIIICGRCGSRMTVRYHARGGTRPAHLRLPARRHRATPAGSAPRSPATPSTSASASCSSTPSPRWPPRPPSRSPPNSSTEPTDADALRAAHVERARYHADLARRRYLAVDPANRLVAEHPRSRLEHRPARPQRRPGRLRQGPRAARPGSSPTPRRPGSRQLVTDLPGIWNDPATPTRERKRIARLLLTDVTVTRTSDTITAHVRLAGGQHRTLTLPVPEPAWEDPADPARRHRRDRPAARPPHQRRDRRHPQRPRPDQRRRPPLPPRSSSSASPRRLPSTQPPPAAPRRRPAHPHRDGPALGVATVTVKIWHHAGLVSGQRYNDKGQVPLRPARPQPTSPRTKDARRHRRDRMTSADTPRNRSTDPKRCSMQPKVSPAAT